MRRLFARDPSTAAWLLALLALGLSSAAFGFPAPLGVYFLGMVIGSLIAFLALGLVLIYRTNRIINFAQGDIGAVAVVVTVLLVSESKINYFLGALFGIVIALLLGALIEVAVIRRFFKAPRLILSIATIGLTQLLVFIEILLPAIWGTDFVTAFATPFRWSLRIPDPTGNTPAVIFSANHVIALLSVPLALGLLTLYLRYTSAGVASRAVADNVDRASLLGIPVKRISTIVWTVAAGLSAFGALMRAPAVGLSIVGGAFGAPLLIRALAPAVAGRMENMRTTFIAALVLGVVDQAAFFKTHDESMSNMILFLVILGALMLQRRRVVLRGEDFMGASWQAVKEVRPIPTEMKTLPEVRFGSKVAFALLLLVVLLAGFSSPFLVSLILIYSIVGLSLVVLTGWAGQISLGQFAFVAVGAAVASDLAIDRGWNLALALLAASIIGAVVAAVIGLPALRIRGLFLAASTIAFGLFVSSMVLNPGYFGWLSPKGRFDVPDLFGLNLSSKRVFFVFCLVVTMLALASVTSLRRSRIGRVLIAGRDNERAVRAFGVNLTAARLAAFAISGFFASLAGGLYAMHQNAIYAVSFGVEKSLQVFTMVVIGGLASIPGAFLGAFYYFVTTYLIRSPWSLLASGVGMLILLMILPGGLGQVVYGWRDGILRFIAKRRDLVVPSLVADVRVDDSVLLPGAPATPEPSLTRGRP